MRRTLLLSTALFIASATTTTLATGQSMELAKDYSQHGLDDKAKDILITAIHTSATPPASKAKALYLLGTISFDEGHVTVALTDWQTLVKDYPETPEAKEIGARLAQLSEMVTKISEDNVTSAVARSYLSNGDFWSKGEDKFIIDSSWLPEVELASQWYDRVIAEFPGSDAAELGYEKKLVALLGSRDPGGNHSYGLTADYSKYLPQVLDTFGAMEAAFPKDSSLPALRYQIAQAYWGHKDWTNTRLWLQRIIDKSDGEHTFYTELAKARLLKIEY